MRSLGGVLPSAPNAEEGMIVGKPAMAPDAAKVPFKKSRRFSGFGCAPLFLPAAIVPLSNLFLYSDSG
jgi:hypothetical protein